MNWYLHKHCLSKRIMTRHNIYSLQIRPSSLSYSHVKLQNQLTAQLYIHNTANTEHLKKKWFSSSLLYSHVKLQNQNILKANYFILRCHSHIKLQNVELVSVVHGPALIFTVQRKLAKKVQLRMLINNYLTMHYLEQTKILC